MDYAFFENLTHHEAQEYLTRYLDVEARETGRMLAVARADGVEANYSIGSLTDFFRWLRPKINVLKSEPDAEVPTWLRTSMEANHGGFLDFDEQTRVVALRASYYLGESFARLSGFEWSTGRPDRAEANQPVVRGFRTGADLPPLVVAENVLLTASDSTYMKRVEAAVATWDSAR